MACLLAIATILVDECEPGIDVVTASLLTV
jgi:hypothetical protein